MEDFNDSCSSLKFIDDVFLKSADPDEAVLKLEECGHAISDIALGNFQFERIFQLDFFLGLKCMSMKSMFCCNSSKELICNRALLAWQLLAAADSKSAAVKQLGFLSSDIRNAIEDARICLHPYTRGHGKYVREYDEVLSSLCADGDAALFPRALGEQDFIKYLSKIGYSLFRKRVL